MSDCQQLESQRAPIHEEPAHDHEGVAAHRLPLTSAERAKQMRAVVERAAELLAAKVWEEQREALDFLSPAQLCGRLDLSPKTLATLDTPRHVIVEGKVIRYRIQDVEAWAATKRECP